MDASVTSAGSGLGDILYAFGAIALEGMPFIVLGTLLSGFIDAFLPPGLLEKMLPRNRWLAVVMSALFGGILPVCECAIVPVIRRLVKKGLPVSCAVTYMLAAPIINPITALSTHAAFANDSVMKWFMPSSRLLMAFVVTVIVGWIVNKMSIRSVLKPSVAEGLDDGATVTTTDAKSCCSDKSGEKSGCCHHESGHQHTHVCGHHYHDHEHGHDHDGKCCGHHHDQAPQVARKGLFDSKLLHALRTARHDLLDTTMYFIIGALITALFNTKFLIRSDIQDVVQNVAGNNLIAVPVLMILASVLSLCSTTDAFIAANLTAFSWISKLAFLVFGPMVDLKLLFMYSTVFKKSFVAFLVALLFVLICLLCVFLFSVNPLARYGH